MDDVTHGTCVKERKKRGRFTLSIIPPRTVAYALFANSDRLCSALGRFWGCKKSIVGDVLD